MITYKCETCGKEFEAYPSQKRRFCSKKCANVRQTQKKNDSKEEFICEHCGKLFYRTAREIKNAKNNGNSIRFCSKKCKSENWGKNRIEQICYVCGKKFLVQKQWAGPHKCCSPECSAKNEYNRMLWEKQSPTNMYIIRKSKEYRRWHRKIVKRDKNKCQKCDNILDLPIQIHHIIPLYDIAKKYNFDVKTVLASKEFNDINNGITLCVVCHAKEHPENEPMQKALENNTFIKENQNSAVQG